MKNEFINKKFLFLILINIFLINCNNFVFADSGYKGHWPKQIDAVSNSKIKTDNEYIEVYVGAGEEFDKINTIIPNGSYVSIYGNIIKNNEKWSLVEVYEFDYEKIKYRINNWWNNEYYENTISILQDFINDNKKIEFAKFIYGDEGDGLLYLKNDLKKSGWIKTIYLEN